MTTLTITLDHVCAGGDHMRLGLVLDGQARRSVQVLRAELLEPFTEQEILDAIKVMVRLHARGKTNAQVRNNLQTGIVVNV